VRALGVEPSLALPRARVPACATAAAPRDRLFWAASCCSCSATPTHCSGSPTRR